MQGGLTLLARSLYSSRSLVWNAGEEVRPYTALIGDPAETAIGGSERQMGEEYAALKAA